MSGDVSRRTLIQRKTREISWCGRRDRQPQHLSIEPKKGILAGRCGLVPAGSAQQFVMPGGQATVEAVLEDGVFQAGSTA
jgi:hypothetical protein